MVVSGASTLYLFPCPPNSFLSSIVTLILFHLRSVICKARVVETFWERRFLPFKRSSKEKGVSFFQMSFGSWWTWKLDEVWLSMTGSGELPGNRTWAKVCLYSLLISLIINDQFELGYLPLLHQKISNIYYRI